MAKKPPTAVASSMQPEEPEQPFTSEAESFDTESFGTWLAKMAKRIGSELVEKALLAFYVLIDPRTPNHARLILTGALAYLVLPVDAIPDFLPIGGFVDDTAALIAAIAAIADNTRVRHLREAREQMNEWGIVINLVPQEWDDDACLSDADLGDPGTQAA